MRTPVKVTDASVRECVLYGNLHLRGEDTDQIGTSLTVEISDAFDRWLASVKAEAWDEGADATAEYIENGGECELPNPYRQKREEADRG